MAMRLMRTIEIPETPRDRVFRASRLYAVMFVMACLGASVAAIVGQWPTPASARYLAIVIIVVLLFIRRFIIARFHPSNWLVRMGDEGLYIHLRSYLNDNMANEDATVAFLPYPDIRSARLVHERLKTHDSSNSVKTQTLRWVEFELAIDPTPLAMALAAEGARPGPWERRWYGRTATLYKDYPVLMQTPPFLRVRWQVVPRASVFLDALRPQIEIAPNVATTDDFTHLQELSREEQLQRLRDLEQRGDTIAAIYLARKLFALDLTKATNLVESLRETPR